MAEKDTASAPPTDDERVTVKPDSRGGYTVEKFGASTHFTREQWDNLLDGVDEADAAQAEKNKAPSTSESTAPKSTK